MKYAIDVIIFSMKLGFFAISIHVESPGFEHEAVKFTVGNINL